MSSEDLKSLIVTDPDIVDEGIDISGLRTQTDTDPRLLASIADFPGISYDPTEFSYLSDLNELFGYGLPLVEEGKVLPPATGDGGGGSGGGGQATLPSITDTTSEPTFIGGGATLEDAGGVPELGGVYATDYQGDPLVDQMSEVSIPTQTINPLAEEMSEVSIPVVDPLAEEMSEVSIPITDTFIGGGATLEDAGGIPELGGGMGPDYQGDPNIIAPSGDIFAQGDPLAQEKIDFTPEQQSTVQNILGQAGQTVEGALTQLGKIPGAVVDFANQTVDVFGKKLDVGKTLGSLVINKIAGGPVSLIFDAITSKPSASQLEYQGYTDDQKSAIDKEYGPGGVMEGYNAVSAFGKGALETVQDRLEERTSNGIFDDTTDKLNELAEKLGGTPIDAPAYENEVALTGGDDTAPNQTTSVNEADVEAGLATESISDFADDFDDGTMTGEAADSMDDVLGPMPEETNIVDEVALTGGDGPSEDTGGYVGGGGSGVPDQIGGGGDGGNGGCFLAGTLVTMADGSTKPVEQVDLKDNVAEGGKVFATGKFLVENLHDYKGIKVSGSHMVNEDNKWVRVKNSKHGKPLGDDEHTVYVFGSENRKILINGILFTDYFEVKEQEKFLEDEKKFFKNWKQFSNEHNESNVNILNAS
jgi:hypothetical protein